MSVWTLKRRLRDFGLYGRLAHKKPLVSLRNRVRRLSFAKDHSDWTVEDWKKCSSLMKPKLIWLVLMANLVSDVLKKKILTHNLLRGNCKLRVVQYLCGVLFAMMVLVSLCKYRIHLTQRSTESARRNSGTICEREYGKKIDVSTRQ